MSHPARANTTYSGNRADGDFTNIYGNVYGDVRFAAIAHEVGEPSAHQCLRDLLVTDPREDLRRIRSEKDELLRDCYDWVLEDASFQRWRTEHASRLLWISGDPGKGKMMMTMGVIAEFWRSRSWQEETAPEASMLSDNSKSLLSFFFCQNTVPALNNAVSVLRGLFTMLVVQKRSLLRYVQEKYKVAGRQLFDGHDAKYSLQSILSDSLDDASLPPTYLLVSSSTATIAASSTRRFAASWSAFSAQAARSILSEACSSN